MHIVFKKYWEGVYIYHVIHASQVRDGSFSLDEAREEFLRQWELVAQLWSKMIWETKDHPEGRITWDTFKEYYEDVQNSGL